MVGRWGGWLVGVGDGWYAYSNQTETISKSLNRCTVCLFAVSFVQTHASGNLCSTGGVYGLVDSFDGMQRAVGCDKHEKHKHVRMRSHMEHTEQAERA